MQTFRVLILRKHQKVQLEKRTHCHVCTFRTICQNLFGCSLHPYHLPPVQWGSWTISFVRSLPTLTSLHLPMRAPQLWNSLPCQNEAARIKAHLNIQALGSQKQGRRNYLGAVRSKAYFQVPRFAFALCQVQRWAIFFRLAEIKINSTAKTENSPNADACKQTHSFWELQQQLKINFTNKINSSLEGTPGISLFFPLHPQDALYKESTKRRISGLNTAGFNYKNPYCSWVTPWEVQF